MFLLKLTICIILSFIFFVIARRAVKSQRKTKVQVQRTLQKNGWTCLEQTSYGKSWIALYQKLLRKQVVLVNENSLTFDDLRKAVIVALRSRADKINLYYYQITPHAKKALHLLSKSKKHHRIELVHGSL